MNYDQLINLLLSSNSSLPGVGSKISAQLESLVGRGRVFDLLLHRPTRIEKVKIFPRLFEVESGQKVVAKVKVESHSKPQKARQPFKIICYSPTGYVNLIFFKLYPTQLSKMAVGKELVVSGVLQKGPSGENQITHPNISESSDLSKQESLDVIYPLNYAISNKFLRSKLLQIINKIKSFGGKHIEWIDPSLIRQKNWPDFFDALTHLHYVFDEKDSERYFKLWHIARTRLAYDELLAWQIGMMITKERSRPTKEFIAPQNDLSNQLISSLDFDLTDDQIKVIAEIESEMFSTKKMLRLIQGDVGSGKTIVAMICSLKKIAAGQQVCLLVPTTVLAKQHFGYFKKHLEGFDLEIEILTSATTKKQKEKICAKLIDGSLDIIVSTHAVLEDDVKFKDLGLAIIDEQHRFGVMQRIKLLEKSPNIDALLMSATPIPRSMMMALYGEMDISLIKQKPKNRQDITTVIMSRGRCEEIYESIYGTIESGQKVYWICPAIEREEKQRGDNEEDDGEKDIILLDPSESDHDSDLITVKERYEELIKFFDSKKVAVVHGKMNEKEKTKVVEEFANPDSATDILVSTTVIEVGIDVGLATVIIIENAEHFGLAQLHQLRGRVGRSDRKSFCILLYGKKFGLKSRQRLNILKQSNDGFFIAEEDLKLRGGGEMLGTRQSGLPLFKIADLDQDGELLKLAYNQAKRSFDKKSLNIENSYSSLLKLFSYDELVNVIKSG